MTDGIASALAQAKAAAVGRDIRIGGDAATVRQFLQARLVDEMHLPVRPVFMGTSETLWRGLDMRALGYEVAEVMPGEQAPHVIVRRQV